MFIVLIDEIENLDNSFTQSNCVVQVNVTNETIQFCEQKLIDKNRCEWSFNTIAPAYSKLRQYDLVDCYVSFSNSQILDC